MEKDLKHGKVIEKIVGFLDFVEDYGSFIEDQTKRNGYIVGDGRVKHFLDSSDLDKLIEERGLTLREEVLVREEFNDDRLNGIWAHHCDAESDWYTEWLNKCSFDDYKKRARLYGMYLIKN